MWTNMEVDLRSAPKLSRHTCAYLLGCQALYLLFLCLPLGDTGAQTST